MMTKPVSYADLFVEAKKRDWRVRLHVEPGGAAIITNKPSRLSALTVHNKDGEELGCVYLNKRALLDEATGILLEDMRRV